MLRDQLSIAMKSAEVRSVNIDIIRIHVSSRVRCPFDLQLCDVFATFTLCHGLRLNSSFAIMHPYHQP